MSSNAHLIAIDVGGHALLDDKDDTRNEKSAHAKRAKKEEPHQLWTNHVNVRLLCQKIHEECDNTALVERRLDGATRPSSPDPGGPGRECPCRPSYLGGSLGGTDGAPRLAAGTQRGREQISDLRSFEILK